MYRSIIGLVYQCLVGESVTTLSDVSNRLFFESKSQATVRRFLSNMATGTETVRILPDILTSRILVQDIIWKKAMPIYHI